MHFVDLIVKQGNVIASAGVVVLVRIANAKMLRYVPA